MKFMLLLIILNIVITKVNNAVEMVFVIAENAFVILDFLEFIVNKILNAHYALEIIKFVLKINVNVKKDGLEINVLLKLNALILIVVNMEYVGMENAYVKLDI